MWASRCHIFVILLYVRIGVVCCTQNVSHLLHFLSDFLVEKHPNHRTKVGLEIMRKNHIKSWQFEQCDWLFRVEFVCCECVQIEQRFSETKNHYHDRIGFQNRENFSCALSTATRHVSRAEWVRKSYYYLSIKATKKKSKRKQFAQIAKETGVACATLVI